jgi:2-keto-3-deoxy-L-rhamnonate aldolase RhmA
VEAVRYPPLGHRGAAGGTRAARFGTVSWDEHCEQSNREVLLSVMVEDARGIDDIEKIAALDGIDLVAVGPNDFSEYMGIRDPSDPRLKVRLKELADQVRKIGKAKLAVTMDHASMPLTALELLDLGVGYSHVAPSPAAVLLRSMRERVHNIHKAVGRS